MRYRILASFQGAPYEAGVGPDESDVVLFAACPPPEALKFEPATGHWRKRVSRGQVQALYESRPVGMFRGERCIVLDDLSDRLHIVYLGHDAIRAAQLGYWEVDRGVFELITPRHEVTDIVEQRRPLPIGNDSEQHTWPGSMPSERSDDYSTATGNGVPFGGLEQRASRVGLPAKHSQELPIAGLGRPEPIATKPVDPSEVAIPPVPEPPLPLEAEALRAASSAARRGQKSAQPRQAQPPAAQPVPAQPAPAPPVAAQPVAATAPAAAAEVSQPLPAPLPAAATLSKAAMLSHAAATAARLAAAGKQSDQPTSPAAATSEASPTTEPASPAQESQPRGEMATDAAVAPPQASEHLEKAAAAEVTTAGGMAPGIAAHADQQPAEPVAAAREPMAAAPASSGQEGPTAPELGDPAVALPAEPEGAVAVAPLPAAPEPGLPTPMAGDHAEGTMSAPLMGISDPPSVAHPAAAAFPSWIPQGPMQPQAGFDAVPTVQPAHDVASDQAGYSAPYVAHKPATPNGSAAANGTAGLGLTAPMPHQPPGFPSPSTFMAHPGPLLPPNEMPAPAAADQGTTTRRRRGTKRRLPTQKIFSDLATQAAIPATAYAIGEDVDGSMCLLRTDEGFEVFNSAGGARHEVRLFQDEESAYFYLFGILVAESVRTGALVPRD
jgi:hypothetical protein